MNCAIYCRKSTKQNVGEEDKSVARQEANARAFAAAKGWTVVAVYADDGISGAETDKLIQKQALLADLKRFDAIVMQSTDRFSRRDGDEAFGELKTIARQGIEIWFYSTGLRFEHGTFASNTLGFLNAEFGAEFRRAIASKTKEAMIRRAEQGYATGKPAYGYDHVRMGGHVERVVNEAEAAVVREIFGRYADGEGDKVIAYALNAKAKRAIWSAGQVRAILKRPTYRGIVVYNKTHKKDADGSRHRGPQPRNPEAQWITVDKPELRIVDQRTLDLVDARLEMRRQTYVGYGRPKGTGAKHLLSGMIQCECGAMFTVLRGQYVCGARRAKGPTACPSNRSFPVAAFDRIFLRALEDVVLKPSFVDRVLDAVFAQNAQREALSAERERLIVEIAHLTTAITIGGDIPALVTALSERDQKLKAVGAQLVQPAPDREALKAALELRRADWQDVLRGPHIASARMILRHLVDLPIRVKSEPMPAYIKNSKSHGRWLATARPAGLLIGNGVSRTGRAIARAMASATAPACCRGPRASVAFPDSRAMTPANSVSVETGNTTVT